MYDWLKAAKCQLTGTANYHLYELPGLRDWVTLLLIYLLQDNNTIVYIRQMWLV